MLKRVVTTNEEGYKRATLVQPGDLQSTGLPSMPPSLEDLDWDAIKRETHNILVEHEVLTWADWQSLPTPMVALNPLRRHLIALYKGAQGG